jgi:hypothetical protein
MIKKVSLSQQAREAVAHFKSNEDLQRYCLKVIRTFREQFQLINSHYAKQQDSITYRETTTLYCDTAMDEP